MTITPASVRASTASGAPVSTQRRGSEQPGMFRQFIILLLSGAIVLLATFAHAEKLNVHLILGDSTPHQQFSDALNKALAANNANVTVISARVGEKFQPVGNTKIDLTIAVGMKATEFAIASSDSSLLSVMINRSVYETLREKRPSPRLPKEMSAIYLDQPWDRQLNFIHAALPKHNVVGLLYSPDAHIVLPHPPAGMSVNTRPVRSIETFYSTLENILDNSDVLLATPDNEIYSSHNLRNILLTSYRYKVPLIGISQAFVKAGALCAIFSTPEQLALQTAEMIVLFANDRLLPEPQYPGLFSIEVNQQVAHSLGIVLDTPEAIRHRMSKVREVKQ